MITKSPVEVAVAVGSSAVTEPQAQTNGLASRQSDRTNSFDTITRSKNNPYNRMQPEGLPRNMNFDSDNEAGNESDDDNTLETLSLEEATLTTQFDQLNLNEDKASEQELRLCQAFLRLGKHFIPILLEECTASEESQDLIGHNHNQDLLTRGPERKKKPERTTPISRINISVSRIHGNGGSIVQNSSVDPTHTSTSFNNQLTTSTFPSDSLNNDRFSVASQPMHFLVGPTHTSTSFNNQLTTCAFPSDSLNNDRFNVASQPMHFLMGPTHTSTSFNNELTTCGFPSDSLNNDRFNVASQPMHFLVDQSHTSTSFNNEMATCAFPSDSLDSDCFDVDSLLIDIEEIKGLISNTLFCEYFYDKMEADLQRLSISPCSEDIRNASMEVSRVMPSTSWAQTTPLPTPSPQGQHSSASFYSASPITSPYGESSGYSSCGTMSPTGSETDVESVDTVSNQLPQNCLASQPSLVNQLPKNLPSSQQTHRRQQQPLAPLQPKPAPNQTHITPFGEAMHRQPISACERLSRIANSKNKKIFFIVELVKVLMSIKTIPNNEVESFKSSLWQVMKNPQQRNFEMAIFAHLEFLKAPIRVQTYKSVLSMKNQNGHSLLFVAAVELKTPLIARYIAEVMNHVNPSLYKAYEKGNTILHDVAQQGDSHLKVLLELLAASDKDNIRIYNVNELNQKGETVLMAALSNAGHPYINTVRLLLQEKADPWIKDRSGLIALQYLVKLVSNHKLQHRTDKWPREDQELATKLLPIPTRNVHVWGKLCVDPSIPDFLKRQL